MLLRHYRAVLIINVPLHVNTVLRPSSYNALKMGPLDVGDRLDVRLFFHFSVTLVSIQTVLVNGPIVWSTQNRGGSRNFERGGGAQKVSSPELPCSRFDSFLNLL